MSYLHRVWLSLATLLVVAIPRGSAAQNHVHSHEDGQIVTLDEVLALIDTRNLRLEAARLRAEEMAQVPDQVSAWPDPVLGVGYQPVPMLTAHGTQRSQWSLAQTVPFPGKLGLRQEIATLDAEAAVFESAALKEDLILSAKEAYFELYRLARIEELIARFHAELQGFEEASAARYAVGGGPQRALLKAQLEKNRLAQQLHHIETGRRRAAEILTRLTNLPDGPRFYRTATPLYPEATVALSADRVTASIEHQPEFAALRTAALRAGREIELARMERYPDVDLSISYHDIAATDGAAGANGKDALSVGATLRIPLQRSRIRAQVQEARVRRERIQAQQDALRSEFETRIQELLAVIDHEQRAIEEYDSILLPQAAFLVESTRNAYSGGTADFLDLLDAERSVFDLRTSHVDAEARLLTASARLERALGIRSIEELRSFTRSNIPLTP